MITKEFILENKDKWEEYKEEINELDKDILRDLIIEEPDIVDFIDFHKLAGYSIPWILKHHPRLIDYFKPYLDKLGGADIFYILRYHPGLIKDLKPYLDKIDGENIRDVLMDHPDLIKDLKPYLHKLTDWPIFWILIRQPKLIKDLRPYLDKLDESRIPYILEKRPELSLFFKYLNTQYEDTAYYCACPSEISKLDEEEKYELSKKMVELIRKEKKSC